MDKTNTLIDVGRTARCRLTIRNVLIMAVGLTLVYAVTSDVGTVVGIALGIIVLEVIQSLGETRSVPDRWIGTGVGIVVTVVSLVWLGYELTAASDTGGPAWFPALTTLVGLWFLLDARTGGQTYGDEHDEEMGFTEFMTVINHSSLVVEELKEGPKTVGELADACDLTESRIREALDVGTDNGVIYKVNNDDLEEDRYALDESMLGPVAFVRLNGKRLLSRLARPFR